MMYRKLGRSGLSVSEIGLGTAQIGGPSLIGGRYVGAPKIERIDASRILETAFNVGINFFDSSDKYGDGEAERLLGNTFHDRRGQVVLATKCGITASGDRCFSRDYVRTCVEKSLKNLKTDYIDVFQLTKPGIGMMKSGDIYNTLDELKKEGKIRFSGISTGNDEEVLCLIEDNRVDTLQIFYNLLYIKPNELFIRKVFDAGMGLIVRSPLSSGVLTGKFNYDTKFSKEDDRSDFLYGKLLASRIDMINKIKEHFSLTANYNIMEFALNYLLSNEKISTIIPGASKVDHLSGIIALCEKERIEPKLFREIEVFIKENYVE
jgi:aryl-alcohol dehydrogenase-like predicted oxidoreductase